MIPPSASEHLQETVEVTTTDNRERCDTGGSNKIMSMDLFFDALQQSEGFQLDGGLSALSSEDVMMRLKSSELVKDLLLPSTAAAAAATAASSAKAEQPSTSSDRKPPRQKETRQKEKMSKLKPKKLERNTTGDDVVLLNMSFRTSSSDWPKDMQNEPVNLMVMQPSFVLHTHQAFLNVDANNADMVIQHSRSNSPPDEYEEHEVPLRSSGHHPTTMPTLKNLRISSKDWVTDFPIESVDTRPVHPTVFMEFLENASAPEILAQLSPLPPTLNSPEYCDEEAPASPRRHSKSTPALTNPANTNIPTTSPASTLVAKTSRPSTIASNTKKKKKSRKRELDESYAVKPIDGDVLLGRGGATNKYPGNVRFREKALEFRPWYEQSSKEKKQEIADMLVESVKLAGHRFLGKGDDGLWHEVIGNGAHYKASQALRERIKG